MTSFVCVARFSRRAAAAVAVAGSLTHGGATGDRSGGHSEAEQVCRYRTAVDGARVEQIERQTRGFDHHFLVLCAAAAAHAAAFQRLSTAFEGG